MAEPLGLDAADANAIEEVNLAYDNVKEVDCLDVGKEGSEAWEAAVKRYGVLLPLSKEDKGKHKTKKKRRIVINLSIH